MAYIMMNERFSEMDLEYITPLETMCRTFTLKKNLFKSYIDKICIAAILDFRVLCFSYNFFCNVVHLGCVCGNRVNAEMT